MKKLLLGVLCSLLLLSGCGSSGDDNQIIIYSSMEDYRNEHFQKRFDEQFPDYDIRIEYLNSGEHAARLYSEGADTPADISLDIEYGYLAKLEGVYAILDDYDLSNYVDDALSENGDVLPLVKSVGCMAVNEKVLEDKGVPIPTSYEDLLKPEYKGLIAMANPKSSGTGYMFYKAIINSMGEEAGLEYFDKLSENILQYTSSGSGPTNMLATGEIGIGFNMMSPVVNQINDGVDLEIIFFDEGSPYTMYGAGLIKGSEDDPKVKEVFDFIYSDLIKENNELFFPEQIYKDKMNTIDNYPQNVEYADMSNNTAEEKTRLLELWNN